MSKLSLATEPQRKKTYLRIMSVCVLALYAATLGLGMVYSTVSNNIVYMNSFLMYAIEIGLQILDVALYSVVFAFFVYAISCYGTRPSMPFFASYAILTALRRVASLLLELWISGAIGADDISSVIVYFVLDILTALVVVAIAAHEFKRYREYLMEWKKLRRSAGEDTTPPLLCPFEKVFSKQNPLQVCALKVGILLSAVKIISRIIFDLYIGAPTGVVDLLVMIIYYLSDILIGVVVYAAMLAIFSRLAKKESE